MIESGCQKKRPGRASGEMSKERSAELTFQVKDDASEIRFIEDVLAFCSTKVKGATAKVVDLASDAFGVVVNASQEGVAKDLALVTGGAQVVLDVAGGFFQVKGLEVKADGDALVERFVRGKTELVSEVRLAE